MSAHLCQNPNLFVCQGPYCDPNYHNSDDRWNFGCDRDGCSYNPYRFGSKDFFGRGAVKQVDTTRPFTYVSLLLPPSSLNMS